jgi:hypothetical protein
MCQKNPCPNFGGMPLKTEYLAIDDAFLAMGAIRKVRRQQYEAVEKGESHESHAE